MLLRRERQVHACDLDRNMRGYYLRLLGMRWVIFECVYARLGRVGDARRKDFALVRTQGRHRASQHWALKGYATFLLADSVLKSRKARHSTT